MSAATIAAIASPPGGGARAVIRIGGAEAERIVRATCAFVDPQALVVRGAWRARFDDGRGTQPVVVLWMPAPHSYTREDVAELHLVGSPPLVEAAMARVVAAGALVAAPGEFTRRAFENGRVDLTRAEGVLALVEAATEGERRAATALLFGGLSGRVEGLREALVELRALCEASLDFDEVDTGHVPMEELARLGGEALARLDSALQWEVRRSRASGAPRIVLAGAPNAGKSTLFNVLTGGRALISPLEGTTRDALRGAWTVAGVVCELSDTAGLSEELGAGEDDPDRIAQRHARVEHAAADLILWLADVRRSEAELAEERERLPAGAQSLLVRTKADLLPPGVGETTSVRVSAMNGQGLADLERAVQDALGLASARATASGAVRELGERHLAALRRARAELAGALDELRAGAALDLVAEGLRGVTDALDEIDGRTTPEDVLERLFERFCLGK